ncbi:MAG: MmcQ/YjbR family DNA-binding protein [Lachnospiraceae bacterium]|nr:MmcQ/YjbR family DNA-binding protein [Lachnospiraceae bacterium]
MKERQDAIAYCLTLPEVYEDYPFHDPNWCVIRHRENKKVFAWIFEREGHIWINVKCDPEWREVWRSTYASVQPAYHLNKTWWNSIILDGSIPEEEIRRMIWESYDLTITEREKGGKKKQ